jgi:serine/threonine protein kinase
VGLSIIGSENFLSIFLIHNYPLFVSTTNGERVSLLVNTHTTYRNHLASLGDSVSLGRLVFGVCLELQITVCIQYPFSSAFIMSKSNYEVLETLGTGSFGTVCKLKRKADGKIVVWKDINFGKMSEKEKSQLVAEVNILRDLRNPFIVRYLDRIVDKTTTRLYIIMEFCAGGDLGRVISKCKRDRTTIDEAFIWKVFAQATLALKECHRRVENGETKPIIHRDLKPANIL